MIQYICENVALPAIDYDRVGEWLAEVVKNHGKIMGDLTYIFCDDPKIIEVNRQFLNHDYFTDIITFDYTHGRRVSGDMYISLDTVASNADAVGDRTSANFTVLSCMACSTFAVLTTKDPASAK